MGIFYNKLIKNKNYYFRFLWINVIDQRINYSIIMFEYN